MARVDKERLQEIRERAEKASEGPWRVRAEGVFSPSMSVWDDEPCRIAYLGKTLDGPNGENADFIAHSRSDIPFLLERVGELERITAEQRERMRTYLLERDAARGRVGELESENERLREQMEAASVELQTIALTDSSFVAKRVPPSTSLGRVARLLKPAATD